MAIYLLFILGLFGGAIPIVFALKALAERQDDQDSEQQDMRPPFAGA
jgi:hypothetical protein